MEAVTALLRAPSRRGTPIALSPLTSVGVQQETIYRYVYVKLAAGVAYYGFVPENITTTVEQTSGHVTTAYAPVDLLDERIHLLDRVGGTGTMGLDQPRERGRSMLPSRAWL